jgi:hypothetical protein
MREGMDRIWNKPNKYFDYILFHLKKSSLEEVWPERSFIRTEFYRLYLINKAIPLSINNMIWAVGQKKQKFLDKI